MSNDMIFVWNSSGDETKPFFCDFLQDRKQSHVLYGLRHEFELVYVWSSSKYRSKPFYILYWSEYGPKTFMYGLHQFVKQYHIISGLDQNMQIHYFVYGLHQVMELYLALYVRHQNMEPLFIVCLRKWTNTMLCMDFISIWNWFTKLSCVLYVLEASRTSTVNKTFITENINKINQSTQ